MNEAGGRGYLEGDIDSFVLAASQDGAGVFAGSWQKAGKYPAFFYGQSLNNLYNVCSCVILEWKASGYINCN